MALLRRLERLLERAFDGVAARLSGGALTVQHLQRQVADKVVADRSEQGEPVTRNTYRVRVAEADLKALGGDATALAERMRLVVKQAAESRDLPPTEGLKIDVSSSDKVAVGVVEVDSTYQPRRPNYVLRGGNGGRTATLGDEPLLVGSGEHCGLTLPSRAVSREQARISPQGDGYVLENLSHVNGTTLNGALVNHAVLRDGDQLGFANVSYAVETD